VNKSLASQFNGSRDHSISPCSSTGRFWESTSAFSDMTASVFIVNTPDNPGFVDDAFRGAKRGVNESREQ
jgi:hypothetical protein